MELDKVCGNCVFFRSEPLALPQKQQKIVDDIDTKNRFPDYGKCTATFLDADGDSVRYDFGNFSTFPCTAKDDNNNVLFIPIERLLSTD